MLGLSFKVLAMVGLLVEMVKVRGRRWGMHNVSVGPNKDKKTSMCACNVLCGLLKQKSKKVKAKPERFSLLLMLQRY